MPLLKDGSTREVPAYASVFQHGYPNGISRIAPDEEAKEGFFRLSWLSWLWHASLVLLPRTRVRVGEREAGGVTALH